RLLPRPTLVPYTTLFRSESELDYDEGRNSAISYVSAEWYAYRTVGPDCVELSSPTAWSSTHIRKTGRWIGTEHSSVPLGMLGPEDRKSTRLNSSHVKISY